MIKQQDKDLFEEFLMETYIQQETPLDDMIPDGFEGWLEDLDIDDWLLFGNKFCQAEKLALIDRLEKGIYHARQTTI